MTQKIVIKVEMCCERSRQKAMKIAAGARGVLSVGVEGEELMVVTGNRVDPVCLTNVLRKRKRFRYAKLLTVEEMDDANNNNGDEEEGGGVDGDGQEETETPLTTSACPCNWNDFPQQCPTFYGVVYNDPYPNQCPIL